MAAINLQKNNFVLFLFFSFCIFIIDRLTKYLAFKLPLEGVFLFNNLNFKLYINQGIAFSLPLAQIITIIISSLIIIGLIYFILKNLSLKIYFYLKPASLIILGAFSNLIDRIKFGGVVDFIDFWFLPAFNLADIYIIIGVIWLIFIINPTPFQKGIRHS